MSIEPEETEVIVCDACGATNAAHNQVCVRCDAPLVAAAVESGPPTSPAPHLEQSEQEQVQGCGSFVWTATTIGGLAIILLVGLVNSGLELQEGMEYGWLCLISGLIVIPIAVVGYAVWKRAE